MTYNIIKNTVHIKKTNISNKSDLHTKALADILPHLSTNDNKNTVKI